MDIDPSPASTTSTNEAQPSPARLNHYRDQIRPPPPRRWRPIESPKQSIESPKQVDRVTQSHPLKERVNFVRISADCTRLRINYSKTVRVVIDGIKIISLDVETFRRLKKYLIENKIQFHTYALEEERKIKAVPRRILVGIDTEDVKTDMINQGYIVHSVHRIQRIGGTVVGLVLVVLYKTDEAKNISMNISKVRGLSNTIAEAPYKRGGPGQYHRCQRYGLVAANWHVQSRCVKCLIPHWTNEFSLTKEQGEKLSCANSDNAQNIRETQPVAIHDNNFLALGGKKYQKVTEDGFIPAPVPPTNPWGRKQPPRVKRSRPRGLPCGSVSFFRRGHLNASPVRDTTNFSAFGGKKLPMAFGDGYVPAPTPFLNPWGRKQPLKAEPEPSRETNCRGSPGPAPTRPV
ncbi:hypothetical protein EVAR_17424_1 [Eumeta japonica]|uniref:Nucleic-acid-binding protein from transposon X-element n=1 Tax=Eumeta variegata TaxID=151549 RepID=A0A4C1VB53_EUMVA|nr:hypothetical protein EVAR_17424_1 [Eumeta japonica]